ncbi:hypothetical protein ACA758_04060 [Mycoplasmopsis agassizii]|uniref:hypothetical protein n=1 Tax=Mycoplasmopsis agassizii TaxID=33922 RepID=UPI0035283C1B
MSDNIPKDDREELNIDEYCKELKAYKKNYKLYVNKRKYIFSEDGSQLKHDLSIEGEKIVKETKPTGGKKPKKDKDFNDLYNRLKADLTVYIDEKFDGSEERNEHRFNDFKQETNKRLDSFEEKLVKMDKKIDDRFDEILKAIKEKK